MKKLIMAIGICVALMAGAISIASANGGPHGDYAADGLTDKCAGCHRLHQAQSAIGKLLKAPTPYALCLTCHNGAGSRLDVLDGVRLADTVDPRVPGQTGDGSLNGGGFEYINGAAVTSKHNEDPAENQLYPWGFAGSGQGNYSGGGDGLANTGSNSIALSQPLQCTGCHNPHGTPNYRLLKDSVNGNSVAVRAWYPSGAGGAFTKDEGARGLEAGAPADKYIREYYGSSGSNAFNANGSFGNFCGGCHSAYPSDGATLGLSAPMNGASTVHYRHRTEMPYTNWESVANGYGFSMQNPETNPYLSNVVLRLASNSTQDNTVVTCLTCHRVHGTTATMTGWALSKLVDPAGRSPDAITPSQTTTSRSTLLYLNNRGMCEACHQWRN